MLWERFCNETRYSNVVSLTQSARSETFSCFITRPSVCILVQALLFSIFKNRDVGYVGTRWKTFFVSSRLFS